MSISQDRMLAIIACAKAYKRAFEQVVATMQSEDKRRADPESESEAKARMSLAVLEGEIMRQAEFIPRSAGETLAVEDAHFRRNAKRNVRERTRMRQYRYFHEHGIEYKGEVGHGLSLEELARKDRQAIAPEGGSGTLGAGRAPVRSTSTAPADPSLPTQLTYNNGKEQVEVDVPPEDKGLVEDANNSAALFATGPDTSQDNLLTPEERKIALEVMSEGFARRRAGTGPA